MKSGWFFAHTGTPARRHCWQYRNDHLIIAVMLQADLRGFEWNVTVLQPDHSIITKPYFNSDADSTKLLIELELAALGWSIN